MCWSGRRSLSEVLRNFALMRIAVHFKATSRFWSTRVCFCGAEVPIKWNTFPVRELRELTSNLRHDLGSRHRLLYI